MIVPCGYGGVREPASRLAGLRGTMRAWHLRPSRSARIRGGTTRSGLTLIELAVVLTILGVVVGFAAPYNASGQYQSDAAARQLLTTLMAAERLAVARQHGTRHTAFYDSADPGSAFLFKPRDGARYALAVVPLLGLALVARAIRDWRKHAPPDRLRPAATKGLVFLPT